MASTFVRSVNRRSLSSLHSCMKHRTAPASPRRAAVPGVPSSEAARCSGGSNPSIPARRFSSSSRSVDRMSSSAGEAFEVPFGTGLLLGVPVPATQCRGDGEVELVPELGVPQLQGSLTGLASTFLIYISQNWPGLVDPRPWPLAHC